MEKLETGEHSFMQYLFKRRLWVDHFTVQSILNCNSKVESFRLIKQLEPYIEFITYKNLHLYPTEVAVNFYKYYDEFVKK